ncbi:MAG: hypothetical protein WC796_03145 [Candidatus Pacearchaeota archaeon]|jgi:hypothetical protein
MKTQSRAPKLKFVEGERVKINGNEYAYHGAYTRKGKETHEFVKPFDNGSRMKYHQFRELVQSDDGTLTGIEIEQFTTEFNQVSASFRGSDLYGRARGIWLKGEPKQGEN